MTETSPTQIDINGTTVTLFERKSFSSKNVRWGWRIEHTEEISQTTYATVEDAIANAHKVIGGARCACGDLATMNASTGRTCERCYA